MPVERYCGDCGRKLLPEEDGCPKCGTFHIMEPLPIKINKNGTFKAEIKFISRTKTSKTGRKAKEHLRIDKTRHRKMHIVAEKGSNGNWQTVHDEDVIQQKKKKK